LSQAYSPYLGRYVRKLTSSIGSIYDAHTRSYASPLVAKGSLISYSFPSSAEVGKEAPWNCDVHNIGTDGVIAFGIVNAEGNPGKITVKWDTLVVDVEPGYYWKVYTTGPVPNCTHIITNGKVVFSTKGNYTVRLWGMHQEETWYYDAEVSKNVVVNGGGDTKTKSFAVLSSYGLNLPIGWASVFKNQPLDLKYDPKKTTIAKVTLNVTAVSTVDVRGLTILMNNNEIGGLGWPAFDANKSKSVTIDVTGRIAQNLEGVSSNTFEFNYWIAYGINLLGGTCTITATLLFEYTGEDPNVVIPKEPFTLEWWQWGIIGGVGILGAWALLSSKGYAPSPTIIVTQPYEYIKEKLEERKR